MVLLSYFISSQTTSTQLSLDKDKEQQTIQDKSEKQTMQSVQQAC